MKKNEKLSQEDLDKVRPQVVIAIVVLVFVTGFILLSPFVKKLVPQVNLDQTQEQTVQNQTLAQKLADEPTSNNDGSVIVQEKGASFKMVPTSTNRPAAKK